MAVRDEKRKEEICLKIGKRALEGEGKWLNDKREHLGESHFRLTYLSSCV